MSLLIEVGIALVPMPHVLQVLQCILHPQKGTTASKVVLWEVDADLFTKPQTPESEPTELFSPHLRMGGLRYRMVLKTGEGVQHVSAA